MTGKDVIETIQKYHLEDVEVWFKLIDKIPITERSRRRSKAVEMALLDSERMSAVVLLQNQGFSFAEIAEKLDISESYVRNLARKADKLRMEQM